METSAEKIKMNILLSPSAISTLDKFVETFLLSRAPEFSNILHSIELGNCLTPLLNAANGKEIDFSIRTASGMIEITFDLPTIAGIESLVQIPSYVDEFTLTKLSERKTTVQIYFWQKSTCIPLATNTQQEKVTLGVVSPHMMKEAAAIWHNLYGDKFPWNELTNISKMNASANEKKLMLMGAFNNNGELVASVGTLVRKNPTYIEVPPPAINSGATWWKDIVDELLAKLRFLRPEIILWYVPGNPPYIPTKLGKMMPWGLFWHSGLSRTHQIMAFPCDNNQYELFVPPNLIPSLNELIKSFNLPWTAKPADKAMGSREFEYILKVSTLTKTATLRTLSYGELRSTAKVLTDILKNIVSYGIENIYMDLSLTHPAGVPFATQLLAKRFKPLMILPGGFLRLGMFPVKKAPRIDLSTIPPVLLPFAEYFSE